MMMLIVVLILSCITIAISSNAETGRYLIYPPGFGNKVQVSFIPFVDYNFSRLVAIYLLLYSLSLVSVFLFPIFQQFKVLLGVML